MWFWPPLQFFTELTALASAFGMLGLQAGATAPGYTALFLLVPSEL